MKRLSRAPTILFALGLSGLGVLTLAYGDFVEEWQTVAAWVPLRTVLVYAVAIVLVLGGIGLLFDRARATAIRVVFPVLVIGFLLQLPAIVMAPLVEVNYEGAGELTIILAGGCVLFAADEKWARIGRILFGAALIPIGISHFVYLSNTVSLVPTYFPFRTALSYLTGAAHIAAGLAVLFSVVPRLAAFLETTMLGIFTVLVWVPRIVAGPSSRGLWTEFMASCVITGAAWVVADSIGKRPPSVMT